MYDQQYGQGHDDLYITQTTESHPDANFVINGSTAGCQTCSAPVMPKLAWWQLLAFSATTMIIIFVIITCNNNMRYNI